MPTMQSLSCRNKLKQDKTGGSLQLSPVFGILYSIFQIRVKSTEVAVLITVIYTLLLNSNIPNHEVTSPEYNIYISCSSPKASDHNAACTPLTGRSPIYIFNVCLNRTILICIPWNHLNLLYTTSLKPKINWSPRSPPG